MIELYQFEGCPFCAKVRQELTELGVDWVSRTAPKGSKNRAKLVELGGKEQVPFLYDTERGIKMYESDAIIEYLRKVYGADAENGHASDSAGVCPM